MSRRLAFVAAWWAGLVLASAPARAVNTLEPVAITGDSDNRIDLIVMAEGYTVAEADAFRADADDLLSGFFSYAPWHGYEGGFNLYRVVTESAESGADHPSQGIYRDTYLDAEYDYLGIARLLVVNEALAMTVAVGLLPEVDFVVVLVNDSQYGGSGGSVATVSINAMAVEILLHEFGHSFADLADEYETPYPGYPPGDHEVNVDFDFAFADLGWNHWVEPTTPLPTLMSDALSDYLPVGAYEGARYLSTGIYRPAPSCMMRSLSFDYCHVCREAVVLAIYGLISPMDSATPPPGDVSVDLSAVGAEPARFAVEVPEVGEATGLSVSWWLDDVRVGSATTLNLGPAELAGVGSTASLRCDVFDPTTWVRLDPTDALAESVSWTLSFSGMLPDGGVERDAASAGDASTTTTPGGRRGCGCQGAPGDIGWPLLLLGLWLAIRRRAGRTRKSAWRTPRAPW